MADSTTSQEANQGENRDSNRKRDREDVSENGSSQDVQQQDKANEETSTKDGELPSVESQNGSHPQESTAQNRSNSEPSEEERPSSDTKSAQGEANSEKVGDEEGHCKKELSVGTVQNGKSDELPSELPKDKEHNGDTTTPQEGGDEGTSPVSDTKPSSEKEGSETKETSKPAESEGLETVEKGNPVEKSELPQVEGSKSDETTGEAKKTEETYPEEKSDKQNATEEAKPQEKSVEPRVAEKPQEKSQDAIAKDDTKSESTSKEPQPQDTVSKPEDDKQGVTAVEESKPESKCEEPKPQEKNEDTKASGGQEVTNETNPDKEQKGTESTDGADMKRESDADEVPTIGSSFGGEPLMSGYMVKQGGGIGFNNWNRRWFVLYGKTLSYYKKSSDAKPLNVIDLTKSRGVRNVDQCSCAWPKPFNLDVCFGLALEGRTFYFNAETEEELQKWTAVLKQQVQAHGQKDSDFSKDVMGKKKSGVSRLINKLPKQSSVSKDTSSMYKCSVHLYVLILCSSVIYVL
jgi:hypothetical protein